MICTSSISFDKIPSIYIFARSSKEKVNLLEVTTNTSKKPEPSVSVDKQQDKISSNYNRREKEPSRDHDKRDYHSSRGSSNRYRDREDYNNRNSGSRRRYSPPSSSRDRHHDRQRGNI